MTTELLGTHDAARLLKCSPPTIRRLADLGELRFARTESGRRIFTADDVRALATKRANAAKTKR